MNGIFHEFGTAVSKMFCGSGYFADEFAEAFRELERLADIVIFPAGYEPIEYARKLQSRNYIQHVFRSLADRNRRRQYERRYIPCAHAYCGVMIWKKGRLVRRKR